MPSLIRAKAKGKFRPCRSDVPKKKVAYFPDRHSGPQIMFLAAGDKKPDLQIMSIPATECKDCPPLRSGVGTAHHLRRFPVYISAIGRHEPGERTASLQSAIQWILGKFPDSKPKVLDGNRIKVVLWAYEAKFVRENISRHYRVRED